MAALLAGGASAAAQAADSAALTGDVEVVAADEESAAKAAAARVAAMSVAEQAASVVMGHIGTTDASALSSYMAAGFGGFILMGPNMPSTEAELRALTAALATDAAAPPLIGIDEEGGDVTRLPWDDEPSALTLKDDPADAARTAFAARGSLVERGGVSVNFGIVADIPSGPDSFIFRRALGTDPASAAERVAAAVQGERPFAISTLKHFPGHGAAEGDSHHMIPSTGMTLDEWHTSTAPPFEAGIDAGAEMLMFGHLAYTAVDALPASLSPRWHEIAREELGFDGVVVTDDLGMLASSGVPEYADAATVALKALAAGGDLMLMVQGSDASTAQHMVDGIVAAVDAGTLPAERLAEAATRVMTLRLQMAASAPSWAPCPECAPAG